MPVELNKFDNSWYQPGRSFAIRLLWAICNVLLLKNPLNLSSKIKVIILKIFGADIGVDVVIKPSVNVKYPWNLKIGNSSWIGEAVWLDSLALIDIGSNVCISQGAYFCTGNHDWTDPHFGLVVKSIAIEDGAWVGAQATVLPGVIVASHSIVAAGAVIAKGTEPYMIYSGNPAKAVKRRIVREARSRQNKGVSSSHLTIS